MSHFSPPDLGLPASRFPSYRPGQAEAILDIASGDERFPLLSAPTGAGKSLIYTSIAKLLDARVLVLVGTKGLQTQLTNDFASIGMVDIRGHKNYSCAIPDAGKYDPVCSLPRERCLYMADVAKASNASIVVSNYAYWMSLAKYSNPMLIGEFDLIVCDEAHTAPDWLADFCAITISGSELKTLLGLDLPLTILDDQEAWGAWSHEAYIAARKRYVEIRDSASSNRSVRLQQLTELGKDLDVLRGVRKSGVEWVGQKVNRGVKFSPVWGHHYAEQWMFRGTPKVLLCSATLSPDVTRYMGIPDNDSRYVEVDSSFDPSRRPFIHVPTTRVDYRMGEGEMRIWMNRVDAVIDERLDRKGIIHTRSYKRAEEIVRRSRHSAIMLTHSTRNTREVVERYRQAEAPCILVSPSVEEGFDFPGDECRWQIIAKVPFIDGRDPVTKARSEQDKSYSNYVTAQSLVQMTGRGMRSASDAAETFLFDNHWHWFRRKARFPKWFTQACVWADTIPPPLDLEAEPQVYTGRRSIRQVGRGRR